MSTDHSHKKTQTCAHSLKHCDHCDCAYCTRCGKEWVQLHIGQLDANKYPNLTPNRWPPDNTMWCDAAAIAQDGTRHTHNML